MKASVVALVTASARSLPTPSVIVVVRGMVVVFVVLPVDRVGVRTLSDVVAALLMMADIRLAVVVTEGTDSVLLLGTSFSGPVELFRADCASIDPVLVTGSGVAEILKGVAKA